MKDLGETDAVRAHSCSYHTRCASVENTLNWVSRSSAGALDMTNCDFSVRFARDAKMRHIIRSRQPDVIIGSDKDQNRGCRRKDEDHMEFLCVV